MSGEATSPQIPGRFVFRALLASAMLACIGLACYGFVRNLDPGWPGAWLPILAFLVSLESIFTERLINAPDQHLEESARLRVAEWITLLVVLRLATSLAYGWSSFLGDLRMWTEEPWTMLDLSFLLGGAVLAGLWAAARKLSQSLQALETDPFERSISPTDPNYDLRSSMPLRGQTDRSAHGQQISRLFLGGGVVMLGITGVAHINISEMEVVMDPSVQWLGINLLAYFALGLALISEVRYATLLATWEVQDIPVLGRLDRRWLALLVTSLALVVVMAALLPTGYSVSLFQAVTQAAQWIVWIGAYVLINIVMIVGYLLALFLSLFSGEPAEAPPAAPMVEPPPFVGNGVEDPAAWMQLVQSLVFWIVLGGGALYAFYHFVQDRWGLFRGFRPWALVRRFWAWLANLWSRASDAVRVVQERIAQRRALRQSQAARRGRRFREARTARERVMQIYVASIRLAGEHGFERSPSMTPAEYLPRLAPSVPEAEADLAELTNTFERARYSQREVSQSDVERAGSCGQALEQALAQRASSEATS